MLDERNRPLVEFASKVLERDEREAVLGDLLESSESFWMGLRDVFGLALRHQADLWKAPWPWLAGFGVALPSSFLLMGVSLSVSCTYQRLVYHKVYDHWSPTGHEGFWLLLCHIFLLIAWSWAGGYVVGSISRRTIWISAALCLFPSLSCFSMFPLGPVSRLCLFLFLLPAIWGVHHGVRNVRVSVRAAFLLALTVTVVMIYAWSSEALWRFNWALIWPAWYLVATAWRSGRSGWTGSRRQMDDASYTRAS
jgi:hypothetical protein